MFEKYFYIIVVILLGVSQLSAGVKLIKKEKLIVSHGKLISIWFAYVILIHIMIFKDSKEFFLNSYGIMILYSIIFAIAFILGKNKYYIVNVGFHDLLKSLTDKHNVDNIDEVKGFEISEYQRNVVILRFIKKEMIDRKIVYLNTLQSVLRNMNNKILSSYAISCLFTGICFLGTTSLIVLDTFN